MYGFLGLIGRVFGLESSEDFLRTLNVFCVVDDVLKLICCRNPILLFLMTRVALYI